MGLIRNIIQKITGKTNTSTTPTPTNTGTYQGPVQQGTSESTFRSTGQSVPSGGSSGSGSSGGSSGGTSSGSGKKIGGSGSGGSYNPTTGVYTDAGGNQMSVAPENIASGTKTTTPDIINKKLGGKGKLGGTGKTEGGMSYVDTKTGKGYEVSPEGVKKEIIPEKSSVQNKQNKFSGKVDVTGSKGLEETKYYVEGEEVGKVSYGTKRIGRNTGKEYFTPGEQTSEVKQPSRLKFVRPEGTEEIEVTKEGISKSIKTPVTTPENEQNNEKEFANNMDYFSSSFNPFSSNSIRGNMENNLSSRNDNDGNFKYKFPKSLKEAGENAKTNLKNSWEFLEKGYNFLEEKTPKIYFNAPSLIGLNFNAGISIIPNKKNSISFEEVVNKSGEKYSNLPRNKRDALVIELQNLEQGNVDKTTNTWVGSEEKYNVYERKYNEYETLNQQVKNRTKGQIIKEESLSFIYSIGKSLPTTSGGLAYRGVEVYAGGKVLKAGGQVISKIPAWIKTPVDIGFTGLTIYSVKEKLTNPEVSSKGLTMDIVFASWMVAPKVVKGGRKVQDIWRTRDMEKIEMPPVEAQPFYRKSPSGDVQAVYMRRYEGFKIFKPKSWIETMQGYKKGQFTKRQYRVIAPEVQASYEGKGWGTNFPFDNPKKHYDWFTGKNIKEYGVPKRSNLPGDIKLKEGFGFSATGEEWSTMEIGEAGQYYSGKGVSVRFLRIDNKYSNLLGEGKMGKKPIVYAGYFKKVNVNPGYEIKVPNPYESGGKPIKKYVFRNPTGQGILNIPGFKQEVEGVVYGSRVPVRKQFYFNLGGRRVPIEEQVFTEGMSETQINKFAKGRRVSGPQYSSLPSMPKNSYYSNIMSSLFSSVSYVSSNSRVSRKSKYSSNPLSYISQFYSYSSQTNYSRASSPSPISPNYSYSPTSRPGGSSYSPNPPNRRSSTLPYQAPLDLRVKKGKRSANTRDYEYAPSLTAVLFNIRGKRGRKVPQNLIYSGFEMRPI